jgi:hypothetical protein
VVVVSVYLVLCALAAVPFGVALSRLLLGRMREVPFEYARHRRQDLVPAVVLAELEVRHAYPRIAALYEVPTQSEPAHR